MFRKAKAQVLSTFFISLYGSNAWVMTTEIQSQVILSMTSGIHQARFDASRTTSVNILIFARLLFLGFLRTKSQHERSSKFQKLGKISSLDMRAAIAINFTLNIPKLTRSVNWNEIRKKMNATNFYKQH